jgi:triosephosphate isomerase
VALEAGLDVILCIGETAGERDAGQLEAVLTRQLGGSLAGIDTSVMARIVLAYEPVWAIGTGRTAEPAQAQEAHALVRHHLRKMHGEASATTPILYGGSVDRKKAPALFAEPDIDGGLIGGASLKADEFLDIIKAAQ